MTEAIKVAKDAQAYLLRQQQQLYQHSVYQTTSSQQPPARQQPVQQVSTASGSASQPGDGHSDLQRELLLQQREQQRLQGALELQRKQYSDLLAQQQQQAALLVAQKQRFEQEQAAAKLREQREKNARVAAELQAAQQALASLKLSQASASQPQFQQQQMFPNIAPATVAQANMVQVMYTPAVGDVPFSPEFEFFRRPDGSIYKVLKQPSTQRSVPSPGLGQQQAYSPQAFPQTSSLASSGAATLEWRINQVTGVPYQVLVQPAPHQHPQLQRPQQNSDSVPLNMQQQQHQISQSHISPQLLQSAGQSADTTAGHRDSSMAQQLKEKVQGIVSLVESGGENKKLKLLDHVRSCPAKWAKKVTLENMNLPVYGYGVTSELTASLSGRAPEMPQEVLLAKLQHLQNTFRVCCLNTTDKEFSSYGWVLARDYAMKVQDRVTQNLTSWESLTSDVQTSDLVASQMEFPRPLEKKISEKEKPKNQSLCNTWNTCTTDKKCQYEVEHPDRTCLRKHECSHCRATLKQSHRHQACKCPNK